MFAIKTLISTKSSTKSGYGYTLDYNAQWLVNNHVYWSACTLLTEHWNYVLVPISWHLCNSLLPQSEKTRIDKVTKTVETTLSSFTYGNRNWLKTRGKVNFSRIDLASRFPSTYTYVTRAAQNNFNKQIVTFAVLFDCLLSAVLLLRRIAKKCPNTKSDFCKG